MATQKKGLGRGLDAIFSEQNESKSENVIDGFIEIDINMLETDVDQPRKNFDKENLTELAASIAVHGILQPLIVTRLEGGFYKIVAGERRYRAARMARLSSVPAIVRELGELEALQVSLVENLQRQDLNPVEEAMCYKRLLDEFSLTQESLAERVGKSRSAVANSMRLLGLDKRVLAFLADGRLSAGHARALLAISDPDKQFELAEHIIDDEISVRQTEELVSAVNAPEKQSSKAKREKADASVYRPLEERLMEAMGTKVVISRRSHDMGKIEIEYYSDKDLERLIWYLEARV